jgi:D-3-phosphoglycerate dehydrogenase / 2-oxoglutarate reductase
VHRAARARLTRVDERVDVPVLEAGRPHGLGDGLQPGPVDGDGDVARRAGGAGVARRDVQEDGARVRRPACRPRVETGAELYWARQPKEGAVAKFKVVTPAGATNYNVAGTGYTLEMEALAPLGAEIVEVAATTEDEFAAAARDADALYAKGRRITKRIVEGLGRCRVIALASVGVDSVDVAAATARGIPVTNVPDTFIEEVADHTMMLILATARRLVTIDRFVRDGRWAEGRPLLSRFPRLWGQTLGLVAFGHVARAVAVRARPFGLHVIAYDPYVEELVLTQHGVEPVTLPELLQRADIVSMHAPSTADAYHLLTEDHFRAMKREALFVNTSRGATVDEPALIRALQEGWIAGAGLDVFEQEPPGAANPLLKMDNVILTPHAASASARFDPVRKRRVGREIALVLSGRWPMSCVNPAVLDTSDLRRWQPHSMERGPGA